MSWLLCLTPFLGRIISRVIYFTARISPVSSCYSTGSCWTFGSFLLQALVSNGAASIQHKSMVSVCASLSWVCTLQRDWRVLEQYQQEFLSFSLHEIDGETDRYGWEYINLLILETNGRLAQILFFPICFSPKIYPDRKQKQRMHILVPAHTDHTERPQIILWCFCSYIIRIFHDSLN